MGRKAKDLTGMKFGRLVVISLNEEVSKQKKRAYWNCKCECGNEKVIGAGSLRNGATTSCGCYQKQKLREMNEEWWKDEEYRRMKSNKAKEQWQDEEFRQKQRNGTKEKWQDEEYRQMQSDKLKEKWQDEEFRQMKSNKLKEQWKDEEFRQMQSELSSKRLKEKWQDEEMKWKMGYKGGITPISIYLRSLNEQWFSNCKQQANYTCELTGKVGKKLHTHHLKAFSTIVIEAHELNNIQVKPQVKDYTKEELHKLEEYVAEWHKDNSNAVVLCEEVHMLFHDLYGRGGNTPEQFEEFKQRYLDGEFEENIK